MKRRYTTMLSVDESRARIKENIDLFPFNFGYETFFGWVKYRIFSINYSDGKIRRNNPIFNKVIGRILTKKGKTIIEFRTFNGLTDTFSLIYIGLGSFLILLFATQGILDLWSMLVFSMLCCIFTALVTFIFTILSTEGKEGEQRLIEFLENILELEG